MTAPIRNPPRRLAAALCGAVLCACGSSESASPPSTLTTGIEVSNQTSGDPIEDGYSVTVDAMPARPLGVNGAVVFADLEPGDHTVTLGGIDPDCGVLGTNPRTVHTTGGTSESVFLVRCSVAGTGRIVVQTYTSGGSGRSYQIETDNGRTADLGPKDQFTFYAVPVGPVTLTLTGEGTGCEVTAPNPRTLQVHEHEQLLSLFKIHCDI
jgi:hypothetical protein